MSFVLRDYQARMVQAIRDAWASGIRRVLGVLPTGAGKTEVACDIVLADSTPERRTLIVVDRKTLCGQWVDRLYRHGAGHVGVLHANNTKGTCAPVLVGTAQTIRSRGVPSDVRLVVIDESHIWHETHDGVLAAVADAFVLGLTATPLRAGLGLRFDAVIIGATIRELIDRGYLVPARYWAPNHERMRAVLAQVALRAGDYAAGQLSRAMRGKAIIGDCVGTWQKRGEDRQTIAFCVDKQHARDLCAEFNAAGTVAAVIVDETKDDERAAIFAAFNDRATRVLCSVGVLSIGFDSPIASCAILARPTLSEALHIQQGGRVLRPAPDKRDALVLDHAGNTITHGLLEDFLPPTQLSDEDSKWSRAKRDDVADVWICRGCEAVNPRGEDICGECGKPRRRHSEVVIIDGELQRVEFGHGEPAPGPTVGRIRDEYRMLRWFAASKGLKDGWAYYAMQRRHHWTDQQGKHIVEWAWRNLPPLEPDAEVSRWLRADSQRAHFARRHRGQAPDARVSGS